MQIGVLAVTTLILFGNLHEHLEASDLHELGMWGFSNCSSSI